ncbi:hypothetical protein [Christiangramia aquimixticola]|uniref:hypothetical protein n=1 Tax=Christiangramia aquimixticola TaxID=1697558 RepID=UPI003AA9679D
METSILVAKILSALYLSFFLGLLFSGDHYKKELPKLVVNSAYLILAGFMAVVFGVLILEFHNNWNMNWTVVITIFGWLALIKGVLLIAIPKAFSNFNSNILRKENHILLLIILLSMGLFFGYFGFFTTS